MEISTGSPRAAFERHIQKAWELHQSGETKIRLAPGGGAYRKWPKAHFHGTPEFFLQVGGATSFECPGGTFRLKHGEIAIVPAGIPHAEEACYFGSPYSAIIAMWNPEGFTLIRSFCDEKNRIGAKDVHEVRGKSGRNAFVFLSQITEDPIFSALMRDFQNQLVGAFLVALLSDLKGGSSTAEPESLTPLVSSARKVALAQLPDPALGVSSVARQVSCHPDHLSRCFQKALGIPFGEWIIRERLQTAKNLLTTSHRNVSEVGWACGFSSPSYFIKLFRARTGSTPNQFRKALTKL
jgi:AraC-like DNA-binding protein/mannose-6-phosphate isomerase-like protein (cupin superfamily)